ncbi:MAG TPA: molybdate ABC transporter substrate-binding protein [Candidatus Binatia bacterium]
MPTIVPATRGPRRLLLVVLLAALVSGRAVPAAPTPGAHGGGGDTITVFAAASLTASFQALATAFEQAHPGTHVQLNFAGSPTLVQQIQDGAPADVFASADEANMQKVVEQKAVVGSPAVFTRNTLEIAVVPGNPKHVAGLADLAKPGLIVALCGPTVPCGRYAAEAIAKAGATMPDASQEPDVKAVLTKVSLGEADAGVVYVTDVKAAAGKVQGVPIPEPGNVVARYPIAALVHAPNAGGAAAFVAFVLSADGQRILATFGFLPR